MASASSPTATSGSKDLLDCSKCHKRLNKRAKTLVCFHNFCENCIPENECPECGEIFSDGGEMSKLSPYLLKMLRREKLESSEWHCDWCQEEDELTLQTSEAKFWCEECEVFLCANCNRFHKKFPETHMLIELNDKKRAIDLIMTDTCLLHGKYRDLFCENCNICYCDICYKKCHSSEPSSSSCLSDPLRVSEEILRRRPSQVPTLQREVKEFEEMVRRSSETISQSIDHLNKEYLFKCEKVWVDFDELIAHGKKNAEKLCDEIKEKKEKQEKEWLDLLKEYKKILKQVEIWHLNFQHLLHQEEYGVVWQGDMLCGLKMLMSKSPPQQKKSSMLSPAEEFLQYKVTLPNWWLPALQPLTNQQNQSGGCCIIKKVEEKKQPENLIQEEQLNIPPSQGLNPDQRRWISSIVASPIDGNLFLCDANQGSLLELTQVGNLRNELFFSMPHEKFYPWDICSTSPNNFVVCGSASRNNILFLERVTNPPFLKITKNIKTKKDYYSLCKKDEIIFCCHFDFKIDCFSEKGEKIQTIQIEGPSFSLYTPRIRFDRSGGKLWGSREKFSKIFSFNSDGKKISSFKREISFFDFCFFDDILLFVNREGIFSFFHKKCLHKFEKKCEHFDPVFSTLGNKICVWVRIDGKNLIKFFTMNYLQEILKNK